MKKIPIILFLIYGMFCISCATAISINVSELTLLEQEQAFSGNESTITAIGMLHAVIETDTELISFSREHEYNLSYSVRGCSSGVRFAEWPDIYAKKLKNNNSYYVYEVIFDYKKPENAIEEVDYNLARKPEDICFVVTAANMNPYNYARSNVARIKMTDSLIKRLKAFDLESRSIYVHSAD